MNLCCQTDGRREVVRESGKWIGLDYAEILDDQKTIYLYFLGKAPPELQDTNTPLEQFLTVSGGQRITGVKVTKLQPVLSTDPEKDDFLIVTVNKSGDFSTYTISLAGVKNVDPRYASVCFSFKANCPSDLDCVPPCACAPPQFDEPSISYLAKDYGSFRQLILDRLAVLMPNWTETHTADIGIALVELLAYTGDYLSYYQDAVATEAYLETARERISVRRHARLVDYKLSEGCNARAFVHLDTSVDHDLDPSIVSFITGINQAIAPKTNMLTWDDLADVPTADYEVFEPVQSNPIHLAAVNNEIHIYSWGLRECCLEKGSTTTDLLGAPQLLVGDLLIFEEVVGPRTGLPADADPLHRWAVRLTSVSASTDNVLLTNNAPTPYVTVEWGDEDALPFTFCVSTIGPTPACAYIENVTVARGNVILVDHGKTQPPENLGQVPTLTTTATCECAGSTGDVEIEPGAFNPTLSQPNITYRQPLPARIVPAAILLKQDVRRAAPQVFLSSQPSQTWTPVYDLAESAASDANFVVEIDNNAIAHLRFGDGELGFQPPAGMNFEATYRVGNGTSGNVGPESISRLVLDNTRLNGVTITVRNPLPAVGATDQESIDEAKLFAPRAFRTQLERAIVAADYAQLAAANPAIQRAAADLEWTGSWYEADVAIDPLGSEDPTASLLSRIQNHLECYRCIGHDLAVLPARYVPIELKLAVCVLPGYQRAHVKAALLNVFSNRVLAGGTLGFFHPDNLTFGEDIYLSQIVAAAQLTPGVECARVVKCHRLFARPNGEILNGVLPLAVNEIAQLDNDPSFPEHGKLSIDVAGGV